MLNIADCIERDFRGCVLISKDNEILFKKSDGYADLSNRVKNELETKFATASAGKVFVAVGILQLIESGKISFDDTLGNIVDFELNNIDSRITVKELLTHTSGVPDYFDESVMDEYDELWENYPNYKIRHSKDLLPLFIEKPMLYPKGERFQYNNSGYVLLGLIIEYITGMPFDLYLKNNVFDRCGMSSTGYYELDRLPAKCANSYIYDDKREEYYTNIYSVDVKGTGAGGAFTTVSDVRKFWSGLISGQLISLSMVSDMMQVQSGNEEEGYYGYGLWLKKEADNTFSAYFQGQDPGVSFISMYHIEESVIITLVSNYGDNVWKNLKSIREHIFTNRKI